MKRIGIFIWVLLPSLVKASDSWSGGELARSYDKSIAAAQVSLESARRGVDGESVAYFEAVVKHLKSEKQKWTGRGGQIKRSAADIQRYDESIERARNSLKNAEAMCDDQEAGYFRAVIDYLTAEKEK